MDRATLNDLDRSIWRARRPQRCAKALIGVNIHRGAALFDDTAFSRCATR
jgi:hypothetical protein